MAAGDEVAAIAQGRGFEQRALTNLLDYVSLRSDIVDRVGRGGKVRFIVAREYGETKFLAHLIDQYVGAFGPCLFDLSTVLRNPAARGRLVDHRRHAAAYSGGKGTIRELAQIIEALEIGSMLDFGCGGGQLIAELALRNPRLVGIGVDANLEMVLSARQLIVDSGVDGRIEILHGDVLEIDRLTTKHQRNAVDLITAVGVANGYFAELPGRGIDDLFGKLRLLFPNRIMIICDYYGRLGLRWNSSDKFKRTLIHDVAQLVSGQGVPPDNLAAWRRIYDRNRCSLITAFEGFNDGVAWFIHVLQL